jgi:hypothetical protein
MLYAINPSIPPRIVEAQKSFLFATSDAPVIAKGWLDRYP